MGRLLLAGGDRGGVGGWVISLMRGCRGVGGIAIVVGDGRLNEWSRKCSKKMNQRRREQVQGLAPCLVCCSLAPSTPHPPLPDPRPCNNFPATS